MIRKLLLFISYIFILQYNLASGNLDDLEKHFAGLEFSATEYVVTFKQEPGSCRISHGDFTSRRNKAGEKLVVRANVPLKLSFDMNAGISFYSWETVPAADIADIAELKPLAPHAYFIYDSFCEDWHGVVVIHKTLVFLTENVNDIDKDKITALLKKNGYSVYVRKGMIVADVPVQRKRPALEAAHAAARAGAVAETAPQLKSCGDVINFLKGSELSEIDFTDQEYFVKIKEPVRVMYDAENANSFRGGAPLSLPGEKLNVGKYTKLTLGAQAGGNILLSVCCWDNTVEEDIEKLAEFKALTPDAYFIRKGNAYFSRTRDWYNKGLKVIIIPVGKLSAENKNKIIEIIKKFPRYSVVSDRKMIMAVDTGEKPLIYSLPPTHRYMRVN